MHETRRQPPRLRRRKSAQRGGQSSRSVAPALRRPCGGWASIAQRPRSSCSGEHVGGAAMRCVIPSKSGLTFNCRQPVVLPITLGLARRDHVGSHGIHLQPCESAMARAPRSASPMDALSRYVSRLQQVPCRTARPRWCGATTARPGMMPCSRVSMHALCAVLENPLLPLGTELWL